MGDYFDEDDLLNDYLEEQEQDEPPPDVFEDDEILNDIELQQQDVDANNHINNQNNGTELEEEPTFQETASRPPLEIITHSISLKEKDLFSFDRYTDSRGWRVPESKAGQIDEVVAASWKEKNHTNGIRKSPRMTNNHNSKSPASQLLASWSNRSRRDDNTRMIMKGSGVTMFPVEGCKSVSMTLGCGTRLHVKQSPPTAVPSNNNNNNNSSSGNLLGMSMTELMAKSDAILRKASHDKNNVALETTTSKKSSFGDTRLWVDKHGPTRFSHLLSDERTNREVLRALRAWDPYVFKREGPKPRFQQQQQKEEPPNKNPRDVRPGESSRVLLLSGPPGVGKTTLAHVVARHAGYRTLEINGSDVRTASALRETVTRAMESSTLSPTGASGKPNCLILDEIDGADAKQAVAALVEIIRADMPEKKGASKKPYLRRPIIFVCNHKYAPALRPLLPFARQFDVSPPSNQRLVARLRAVLGEEDLSVVAGSNILHQLVVSSGGDIRSCLFTLQFAAAKAREKTTLTPSRKSTVVDISPSLQSALKGDGLKDSRNDIADTMAQVFRKRKDKLVRHQSRRCERADRVWKAVEGFGDSSKTMDCIFLNLLGVSYVDPTLERCVLAHEWLSGADQSHVWRQDAVPPAAVAIHFLCRVETRPSLTYSTRPLHDVQHRRETHRGLVGRFTDGLSPHTHRAPLETVPYALWMLAGRGLRNVSSLEILSKQERAAFDHHVATLRALGLTYVVADTPTEMRLEPAIDTLMHFTNLQPPPGQTRPHIPNALKEILAHQAKVESMRQRDRDSTPTALPNAATKRSSSNSNTGKDLGPTKQKTPPLQTLNERPPKRQKMVARNFLGIGAARVKAARSARKAALVVGLGGRGSKEAKLSNTGSGVPLQRVVRFKYKKGFTQAVRTPCRWQDIL